MNLFSIKEIKENMKNKIPIKNSISAKCFPIQGSSKSWLPLLSLGI